MYNPAHFQETRPEVLHRLVHEHPLGLLVTHGSAGLDATPLPFLLDVADDGRAVLRAHVARANPLWRDAAGTEALAVFQGPQAYISPGWYPAKAEHGKVVPTWNYIVVQARGRIAVHDDATWLRSLVERLTQRHEAAQARPWSVDDAPADYLGSMLRAIVGIEIPVERLDGKWKVSQNRGAADRDGVAQGLRALGGDAARAMAEAVDAGAGVGPKRP